MTDLNYQTAPEDIRSLLDEQIAKINSPAFIADDPVQFPRRFEELRDIEITSLLSAAIAWGKRTMICRDAERLLEIMDHKPYDFTMDGAYEDLPDDRNIHRTFFARDLKYYLRGLREIYSRFPSLDAFAASLRVGEGEAPAWELARAMGGVLADANGGTFNSQCVPTNLDKTALKRINMALRWLVRDDGIVDMGVWKSIPKSKLFVPLDVHVGNTARDLGLVSRRANDRKTVELLMEPLRRWRPDDPAIYDFALFGIGVTASQQK